MSFPPQNPALEGPDRPTVPPLIGRIVAIVVGCVWGALSGLAYWLGEPSWETLANFIFRFVGILGIAVFSGVAFAMLFLFVGAAFYSSFQFLFSQAERSPEVTQSRLGCLAIPAMITGAFLATTAGAVLGAMSAARGGEMGDAVIRVGYWSIGVAFLFSICLVRSLSYFRGFFTPGNASRFGITLAVVLAIIALAVFGFSGDGLRRIVMVTLIFALSGAIAAAGYWAVFILPDIIAARARGHLDLASLENADFPPWLKAGMIRTILFLYNFIAIGGGINAGAMCGFLAMSVALAIETWVWKGVAGNPLYWVLAGAVSGAMAGAGWFKPVPPPAELPEPKVVSGGVVQGEVVE